MYDPEERAEMLKQYDALLPRLRSPEVQARMIADGLDPEAALQRVTALRDAFLAADDACEKAQENLLQKGADVADANYEVFKALRRLIREHKQLNPLDPRLEEWEDQLEAMAEQMPKEPEE